MLLRRAVHSIPLLLILWWIAACSRDRPPEAAVGVAPQVSLQKDEIGWVMYEMPTVGFRLALPPHWQRVDLDRKEFDAQFRDMFEDRHLQTMIGDRHELAVRGVKFRALDPGTLRGDYATNVNVIRQAVLPEFDLESELAAVVQRREAKPEVTKPIQKKRMKAVSGVRVRLSYKMFVASPDGPPRKLAITQFLAHCSGELYAITVGSSLIWRRVQNPPLTKSDVVSVCWIETSYLPPEVL